MESEVEQLRKALEANDFEDQKKEKHYKPTDRIGREGFTLIHWACFYNRVKALQHFLSIIKSKELVSVVDIHGWTPLHVCAIRGNEDCLKLLIVNGANATTKDHKGYTCGHCAAIHGNAAVLQLILNAGHDLSITDCRLWTVVHHAAFYGRYQTLQMLAQMDADLLSADSKGNIPAHLSASEGHLECLRLLVYYKHTPSLVITARNNKGATPKDLSIQFQKAACADFLALAVKEIAINAEEDAEEFPGHVAASNGDLQQLMDLVQEGEYDVNTRDRTGSTVAHKGQRLSSFPLLSRLCGLFPLAAGNGHLKCLQWLIENAGADLSVANHLKETPLDVAKKYGRTKCAILIEEGVLLEQSCNYESLGQARQKIDDLEKMLKMSREAYCELGGDLEEDEHERQLRELTEQHAMEVSQLKSKLNLEREKREILESEADRLRLQLHQTNDTLAHYKTLLTSNNQQQASEDSTDCSHCSVRNGKKLTRRRTVPATHHKRTGGAYVELKRNK